MAQYATFGGNFKEHNTTLDASWGDLVVIFSGCDAQIANVVKLAKYKKELKFSSEQAIQATHSAN